MHGLIGSLHPRIASACAAWSACSCVLLAAYEICIVTMHEHGPLKNDGRISMSYKLAC